MVEGPPPQDGGGAATAGGALSSAAPPSSASAKAKADAASPSKLGEDQKGLSLILAIPDHPWTKSTPDAAAVRIAMTVAEAGAHDGKLLEIVREEGLGTDDPTLVTSEANGVINADLTVGANVVSVVSLKSNEGLGSRGVQLIGAGFIVTPSEAEHLGLGKREGLQAHIRPYLNGRDLFQRSRGVMVIDLFGLTEKEVRTRFPEVYQHIIAKVKPERDANRRASYAKNWWIHGEPRRDMRPALSGLNRFVATPATSKHRVFAFVAGQVLPDDALISFGIDDGFQLGVLSSSTHLEWTYANCGLIGVASFEKGHRYLNSQIFDPFPFPDATPEQRATISELAEELDATRKAALAEVPGLTMTEIYNLRAKLQSGEKLSPTDEDRARAARAGIVHRLHEQIDAAVADAYGWADDYRRGDLTPSEIVTRLVALNAARAKEEAEGNIRWLRPEYQIPRFGTAKKG